MILGAGIYQVPLIKKAKEMGFRVVVCSIPGNYPGFTLADKVYYVNTTDKDACLDVARKENIVAVCTTGTDVALPTLGYIVDTLGLKGPSEHSALLSSNKKLMKEAFIHNAVTTAPFCKVGNIESCKDAATQIGYPCILKVVDSSGSRGIEVVRSESDIMDAYHRVLPYTKQSYILVEKYLQGEEMGAQALIYNGELIFSMTHSDEVYMGSTGVPIGHSVPYSDSLHEDIEGAIRLEILKAAKALDIDNAAINADFIIVEGKPHVLEIGARCGATCLAELVGIHFGIDYYTVLIQTALGTLDTNIFNNITDKCAVTAMLVTSDHDGVYDGYVPTINHTHLVDFTIDCQKGERINRFHIGPDRIGHLIVTGGSCDESKTIANVLLAEVNKEIRNHIV